MKKVTPGKNNLGPENELIKDTREAPRVNVRIENGLVDAEVLYAGGGNFAVLFRDENMAKEFNYWLSRRALKEAPGLQLVISQKKMEWKENVLCKELDKVFHMLTEQKRKHARSAPLRGLSVTASCRSTGLPATSVVRGIPGEPDYLASDEILAKMDVARRRGSEPSLANQRLQEVIELEKGYSYPSEFEDLGATAGEYSHIAVVHADGNGMGQRIREIGDECATVEKNRDFVLNLREFSIKVEDAARQALKAVLDKLVKRVIDENGKKVIIHQLSRNVSILIQLKSGKSGYYIPFRPIVFGGDDVTFVCGGRLGLSLATAYLQEFEQRTAGLGKDKGRLTACAGVAIVKSHYPFARAYGLAVELTGSAKSYRTVLESAKFYRTRRDIVGSCLDWHFALSGLSGSIEDIRAREYETNEGSLTLRPVTLYANPEQGQHAWPVVWEGIKAFQKEEWVERRNKIKALRDSLREGPEAVKHFIAAFNKAPLPLVLSEMEDWPTRGWHGDSCGYFDAIELADWFVPLEGETDAPATPLAS